MASPVTPVDASGKEIPQPTLTPDGEVWITETERENNVRTSFALSNISASSWAVVVDLSNTTVWPHDFTGAIHVSQISLQVDKSANSVGLVQLGVVTRINATNGDASMFSSLRFENGTNDLVRDINVSPSQIKCNVVAGVTTKMITNVAVLNDVGLQTDVAIPSASGSTVFPAVGDIVMRFVHTSGGIWTGATGMLYHSHEQA